MKKFIYLSLALALLVGCTSDNETKAPQIGSVKVVEGLEGKKTDKPKSLSDEFKALRGKSAKEIFKSSMNEENRKSVDDIIRWDQ